jgi:ApaG protein
LIARPRFGSPSVASAQPYAAGERDAQKGRFCHGDYPFPRMATAAKNTGSEACTQGVRVVARPSYLPQQSQPSLGKYVWAYRVRITNETMRPLQLRTRHWSIVDADAVCREVDGEGVVGQQPVLTPGESFEYTSFCPLETSWGTMEGWFVLDALDEDEPRRVVAKVGRFYLVS